MTLIFGVTLGFRNQALSQSVGFTVSSPTLSESGGNSIFVWKVEQTTNNTGLSHFVIQNFCLPTGANIHPKILIGLPSQVLMLMVVRCHVNHLVHS